MNDEIRKKIADLLNKEGVQIEIIGPEEVEEIADKYGDRYGPAVEPRKGSFEERSEQFYYLLCHVMETGGMDLSQKHTITIGTLTWRFIRFALKEELWNMSELFSKMPDDYEHDGIPIKPLMKDLGDDMNEAFGKIEEKLKAERRVEIHLREQYAGKKQQAQAEKEAKARRERKRRNKHRKNN